MIKFEHYGKKGGSKQKKMNSRVDFTPMVDMIMLLVTFFMLCTTLLKPQTMQINMPSDKEDIKDENRSQIAASKAITISSTRITRFTTLRVNPTVVPTSPMKVSSSNQHTERMVFARYSLNRTPRLSAKLKSLRLSSLRREHLMYRKNKS